MMPPPTKRCEFKRASDHEACTHEATFLVGIGTRLIDRQGACPMHVAATVKAMIGMDGQHGYGSTTIDFSKSATVTWHPNGIKE